MRRALIVTLLLSLFLGCASGTPDARAPETAEDEQEAPRKRKSKARSRKAKAKADAERKRARSIPKKCARRRGECLPPRRWVEKLCQEVYPDVALHMFRPKTPWKRLYMLARAEPFNASGGMSLLGDKLEPGEEVIALRRRNNNGEFQVGDNAGYDILRWNGACATIHDGDFTTRKPRRIRHSRIEWRLIGLDLRLALEARPEVSESYEARRRSCRGRSVGQVSQECEENDKAFLDTIVDYVRSGKRLPKPSKTP